MDKISACRPYFIGLLGERYCWVPEPHHFRDTTIQQMQLRVLAHE